MVLAALVVLGVAVFVAGVGLLYAGARACPLPEGLDGGPELELAPSTATPVADGPGAAADVPRDSAELGIEQYAAHAEYAPILYEQQVRR